MGKSLIPYYGHNKDQTIERICIIPKTVFPDLVDKIDPVMERQWKFFPSNQCPVPQEKNSLSSSRIFPRWTTKIKNGGRADTAEAENYWKNCTGKISLDKITFKCCPALYHAPCVSRNVLEQLQLLCVFVYKSRTAVHIIAEVKAWDFCCLLPVYHKAWKTLESNNLAWHIQHRVCT